MAKHLENFNCSPGRGGGWITSFVQGKTLDCCLQDGTYLILRFTDGHEAKIGWQDASGNQIKGSPFLENLDVKVQIVGAGLSGTAGKL